LQVKINAIVPPIGYRRSRSKRRWARRSAASRFQINTSSNQYEVIMELLPRDQRDASRWTG